MPEPEVKIATLCDDVRVEQRGKVSLMGIFDKFDLSDFTQPLPSFHVFLRLAFSQEGQYPISFSIKTYEGDFSVGIEGPANATNREEASGKYIAAMNIGFNNLKVPREGNYIITASYANVEICRIPFRVNTVRPPMRQ